MPSPEGCEALVLIQEGLTGIRPGISQGMMEVCREIQTRWDSWRNWLRDLAWLVGLGLELGLGQCLVVAEPQSVADCPRQSSLSSSSSSSWYLSSGSYSTSQRSGSEACNAHLNTVQIAN
ncbi:hypothetical protein ElyMa_005695600 [Elysia marginata]|uniref:Uncharacterized protein n=1 Tax=Elysia marginata TaxID=1093978 RepID=A0AAV4FGQ7_9GAST|nr:hypothetical protein ElyMa_005695600 [Elysia marginata]